jgi:DNA polymerase III epsilon subunit-like protein
VLAKKVWTDLLSYSLPVVANHCDIKFLHHDAEEDAVASAEVALRCCEALSAPEPIAAAEAARLRVGWLSPRAPAKSRFFPIVRCSHNVARRHGTALAQTGSQSPATSILGHIVQTATWTEPCPEARQDEAT